MRTKGRRRFIEVAEQFCADPSNKRLAARLELALGRWGGGKFPKGLESSFAELLIKVGYLMVEHQPRFCTPLGWPVMISTALLVGLGSQVEVQSAINVWASAANKDLYMVAPIPGKPRWVYNPEILEMNPRFARLVVSEELRMLHGWAIVSKTTALRMEELVAQADSSQVIHCYAPAFTLASTVMALLNLPKQLPED